jgi:hypothetical protein
MSTATKLIIPKNGEHADALFKEYSKATIEYFEATDKLSALIGRHEEFAKAKKHAEQVNVKCHAARQALEQHWQEHQCRAQAIGSRGVGTAGQPSL